MGQDGGDDAPLTLQALAGHLASGCKPLDEWRIGSEHEKFPFRAASHEPVPYEPQGIRALLEGLQRFEWRPEFEGANVIALTRGGASVSLEPGGQFELSGAQMESVHDVADETAQHLAEVKAVGEELGIGFLAMGMTPLWRRDEIPVMPKGRYGIMRRYMPTVGGLGLDMMFRTCTVQVNLDFASEADMVRKFRASLALQPVATALFANSPFTEGKPNGWLSYRAHIWTDTDPDRTGLLDFVFEDGFGFERYAEYVADVPMYFVKREGRYIDVAGRSFRDFIDGRLPELPGEHATLKDWADHTTTIFPEVRLKRWLEMRGADSGPEERLNALSALWVGVLYDDAALEAALDLCRGWTAEDRARLREDSARVGLKAEVAGRPLQDVARDLLAIARAGLKARVRPGSGAPDETPYLTPLDEIAESGLTPADRLLELHAGRWRGDVRSAFEELAY
ncbi:MAG TPA: glutamate--cysteine ligase [Caulobacteraceae bacterium]|jgi:glutamate--cysteine ligase